MSIDIFSGLCNKRILITGATGGIGACIADMLSKFKTDIGVHYNTNYHKAKEIQETIIENGSNAEVFGSDLLDTNAAKILIKDFVNRFGGIDILVNNAGAIYGNTSFLKLDEESWNNTFALNIKAPFFLIQEAFPIMSSQGGGKIVNISSISANYGGSSLSLHYACAKSALDCLTIGMAREGAPYNILVNSIRAGFIDTLAHKKIKRSETDIQDRINKILLKRAGQPEDIARMVLYLASNAGNYITGEIITIAGGD